MNRLVYHLWSTYTQNTVTEFIKTEGHTEIKLTPLEGGLQKLFAAHRRCDVATTMATRSTTVDMQ